MGSAGTTVNGHGLSAPRVLEPGDKIGIGQSTLLFTRGPLPGGVKMAAAPEPATADWSKRSTMMNRTIDTGDHPQVNYGSRGLPWKAIVVAVVIGAVLAVIGLKLLR